MIDETEHGVLITLVTQTLINVYTKTSKSFLKGFDSTIAIRGVESNMGYHEYCTNKICICIIADIK